MIIAPIRSEPLDLCKVCSGRPSPGFRAAGENRDGNAERTKRRAPPSFRAQVSARRRLTSSPAMAGETDWALARTRALWLRSRRPTECDAADRPEAGISCADPRL